MTHQVRVTFDDENWSEMVENSPASLQDPEIVRFYVSLGQIVIRGLHGTQATDPTLPELPDSMQSDEEDTE